MAITWLLCDIKTGNVWEELPLTASVDLERTIGAKTSLGVTLAIHSASCPADWVQLLDARRAMIVAVDVDKSAGVDHPIAGYYIANDQAGQPTASFTLSSLEGLLDEVNIRDHEFLAGTDDEGVAAGVLVSDVLVPSFGFLLDVTPTGKTADHSYAFTEDRSVGSALNDLMAAEGGPEWTIRLAWDDASRRNRIVKTIQIGPRIGSVLPSVVIENKHLESRLRNRSSARGDRATYVIATSEGSGDSRPMSAAYVDQNALDAGIPQWETRFSVTGIDNDAALDRIAASGLSRRRFGLTTWEMELGTAKLGCPRVGRDFDAGDTLTIDSGPMFDDPSEWHAAARIIGWRARIVGGNLSTVTPVFWQAPEEGAI